MLPAFTWAKGHTVSSYISSIYFMLWNQQWLTVLMEILPEVAEQSLNPQPSVQYEMTCSFCISFTELLWRSHDSIDMPGSSPKMIAVHFAVAGCQLTFRKPYRMQLSGHWK